MREPWDLSALGPSRSPMTAVVRVPGTSLQISPTRFHAALSRSAAIRHVVQIHTRALLAQFQHVAACHALHSVEARMAGGCSTSTIELTVTSSVTQESLSGVCLV